ncbi:MAG: hypothetical protein SWK90_15820 [Chloroflexota bacterium]|nr:hypothetical protein [Chloroflexota bacterium]
MKIRCIALLSLLALLLAACGSHSQSTPEATPEVGPDTPVQPAPDDSPLPEPRVSPILPPPGSPAESMTAVAHLAAELDISPDEVSVLSSTPVEWSDASLGCPQPGMMYAQVITPGYQFILEARGEQYEIHTDRTGRSVVLCQSTSPHQSGPETIFQVFLAHLTQTYPGFGLGQQGDWVPEDATPPGIVGASTQVWRSGEWSVQISHPVVPQPTYEAILSHQRAGTVWTGTLETGGQVTDTEATILSTSVGPCDETIPPDTLSEWAGVEVTIQDGTIHIEQNLSYVCCAELALAAGQDGTVIKIIESNSGEVCRCMCGYKLTADLTGMSPGTYTVEIWGVQHFDVHPLELLGQSKVTIP